MYEKPHRGPGATRANDGDSDIPKFVPSIDTQDIFRQLITDELRNGRLTPARRRRIVRYSAGLGLSAVQAGRLVKACRQEVLQSSDPAERYHALHLVEAPPTKVPTPVKIAIVVAAAILVDVLLVKWLL